MLILAISSIMSMLIAKIELKTVGKSISCQLYLKNEI